MIDQQPQQLGIVRGAKALLLAGVISSLGALIAAAPASALSQGLIHGTVTDANGPVAGAEIIGVGVNNPIANSTTAADGSYAMQAWPGAYRLGVTPPDGSSDGYATSGTVNVIEGEGVEANVVLPATEGTGQISGNASYADHSADAGVEVLLGPLFFVPKNFKTIKTFTDENGNWNLGQQPAGSYTVSYSVKAGQTYVNVGSDRVLLAAGSNEHLITTLTGPGPEGTLVGTVFSAEGWPSEEASVTITPTAGGTPQSVSVQHDGTFRAVMPTGSYSVYADGGELEDDDATTTTSLVSNGHITDVGHVQLAARPSTPGINAEHEQQDLDWLNAQRAQWGLPAGIASVPLWSQACASHDAYEQRNKVAGHSEDSGQPGFSPGGVWAGEHSILAGGYGWSAEVNPWYDAPIHLNQLMTPDLWRAGLDSSHDNSCMTTWPGMSRPGQVAGTVFTFPGDGTIGLPPSELASEQPTTPNKALSLPDLTGRQLFIYEEGTHRCNRLNILSASLRSAAGPAEVKWMDQEGQLGGYLTGGIIIPVQQLAAYTTYTATVRLGALENICGISAPEVTHSWSFTTGKANPTGAWREYRSAKKKRKHIHHHPTLKLRRRGNHMVVIGVYFKPKKKVVLRRQPGNRLIRRVRPSAKGKFTVALKWGHQPFLIVTAKQGKKTVRVRMEATGGRHGPKH